MKRSYIPTKLAGGYLVTRTGHGTLLDLMSFYYLIDRSRGSPTLQKFFTRALEGTLITDFWSAYDAVERADQQKCWPHLLREISKIEEHLTVELDWNSFSRRLAGVHRDAKKLHGQKGKLDSNDYGMSAAGLDGRLLEIFHSA